MKGGLWRYFERLFFPPGIRAIGLLRSAGSVDDNRSVILVDGDREAAP
jgi:hypothetical protein